MEGENATETGQEQALRDDKGRFLPGASPNPGGKPKGLKDKATKIKEAFFQAFIDEFGDPDNSDSMKSLKEYARLHQTDFLKIVAGLISKDIDRMNINIKAEATTIDGEKATPHMVIFSAIKEECADFKAKIETNNPPL